MSTGKYRLPKVILGICLIGLLGFKDTGIFVKDITALDGNGNKAEFSKYENISLISQRDDNYIVEKEGNRYSIPLDTLIRTSKTTQKYKLIEDKTMTRKPSAIGFKIYKKGDSFQLLKLEDTHGLFEAEDGVKGYFLMADLEAIVEESFTYGRSKVNKVIKDKDTENKDIYFTLVEGQALAIKDFKDNKYIIIDEEKNEFEIESSSIELKRSERQTASRSSYSSKSSMISKVVKSAYDKLGSKYVYGDTGSRGYDCSGLTYSIFLNELGIKLNRSSIVQADNGVKVEKKDLIPGDLVFFKTSSRRIGHVGLYIGDGDMIHASSSQNRVMITNIDQSKYYTARFVTARRIIE